MPVRLACLVFALAAPACLFAQSNGDRGLIVPVPVNLTSEAVKQIEVRVNAALAKAADRPSKIIFWFNPADAEASGSSPGPCADLAAAIRGWPDVNTVAFASRKVSGHAVLPLLCCNELAMSREAKVGEVVPANTDPPLPVHQAAYLELLAKQRPAHFAIVKKMYDRNVKLMKGQRDNADWYYDFRDKGTLPKDVTATNTTAELEAGVVGLFDSDKMSKFGLRKGSAETTGELARLLGIDPASLRDDPLNGRDPVPYRYVLRDSVTPQMKETVERTLKEIVTSGKGNLLFLQIECDGGAAAAARDIAEVLLKFQRPEGGGDGLKVIGFIPNSAHDTAAIIALGCTEVVMSTRKGGGEGSTEGTFGDFGPYLKKTGQDAKTLAPLLRDLAAKQNFPPNLVAGMVDPDLKLVRAQGTKDRRKFQILTPEEVAAQPGEWDVREEIKRPGELLKLSASLARQYGLVSTVIDGSDITDVYPKYGIDPTKVKDATPAWLDWLRDFLRNPWVTIILVIVGFIGLILELKVPGTTIPGIVAALCFILIFWAWAAISNQLAWLAGLLFVLGLVLVLLEVFVLPGFGVCGIVGVGLMLGGIVLVTLDRIPSDQSGWLAVGGKMATYLFALIGAGVVSFLIARFLPKLPLANRMVLKSQADRDAAEPTLLPGAAEAAALLGAIGVASTVLRPAGTVLVGEQFVDVVSDGGFIPAGTRVQVVEVEGTRIVVKEV